jgi:hypothetical protein
LLLEKGDGESTFAFAERQIIACGEWHRDHADDVKNILSQMRIEEIAP